MGTSFLSLNLVLKLCQTLLKKGWLREPYYFMHPYIQGDYKEITENNLIKILEGKEILIEKTMKSRLSNAPLVKVLS